MKGESIKKMNSIIDMLAFNEQIDKETIISMLTEIMRIETPKQVEISVNIKASTKDEAMGLFEEKIDGMF